MQLWYLYIALICLCQAISAFKLGFQQPLPIHSRHSVGSTSNKHLSQPLKMQSDSSDNSNPTFALVGGLGVAANVVCGYSLFVLKTTGCGLPPGPFGLLGAAEGISYLAVVGLVAWSAVTKAKTGSGLPAGPSGLLGASEGLSYLTILAGIVIAGLNLSEYGFLPGFLPNDKCFGV